MTWLFQAGMSIEYNIGEHMLTLDRRVVREADWKPLDNRASRIFKEKQSFDRLEVTRENLQKMFKYSKYKLHYIDKLVTGEKSTVYRCGTLVDLCRGPHIQNTGKIKAFKIMQVTAPYSIWPRNGSGKLTCLRLCLSRTARHTSLVIRARILCSVFVVSPSRIRS